MNQAQRFLQPLAWMYRGAVGVRNALFDAGVRRSHRLPVPVVSVGNLTVGGTGKTPLVMHLVERAHALQRKPGVLARGYGRARGAALNDEGLMLAARFPGLAQVQDPDRVDGGAALLALGVDLVILDDGFQHRRLARDVDLVCLDAAQPFGNGALLPAGVLREPASALRRAHAVVLTRAGALSADALADRVKSLRTIGRPELPVFAAEHVARDLIEMPARANHPVTTLRLRRVGLLSAIARPASFASTVQQLGAEVVWHESYRDHHCFSAGEFAAAVERAARDGCTLVVTEKDDAKLAAFPGSRWVLRIDLRFVGSPPGPEDLGLR